MYIKPSASASDKRKVLLKELNEVKLKGPLPDPVCSNNCPSYNANIGCDRMCTKVPSMLSSEPETYPIDMLVAPLVFEIKKLGVFEPCWSCEGHNDPSGNLWKIPRVWFYASSVVHVRALAVAVSQIYAKFRLNNKWVVEITHSDDNNPDTTFSLHPKLEDSDRSIAELQSDLITIYTNIANEFRSTCRTMEINAI